MYIKNKLLCMIYFEQRLFRRGKIYFRKIEDVNVDKEENLFVDDYGNRRSYNFIITERYYFLVLEVSVKREKKVNLIDQGELTLILVIIFT